MKLANIAKKLKTIKGMILLNKNYTNQQERRIVKSRSTLCQEELATTTARSKDIKDLKRQTHSAVK